MKATVIASCAAAAAAGAVLLAIGLASDEAPPAFPATIERDDPVRGELQALLVAAERAVKHGDLDRLRASLTPRYLAELGDGLANAGGGVIDGFLLSEQKGFVGDMAAMEYCTGAGAGPRAVLVYAAGAAEVGGRALLACTFDASTGAPLLDAKAVRPLRADEDAAAAAATWARALLE